MDTRQKLAYIRDYYKWHIIIALAVVIFLISFIRDMRENSKPSYIDIVFVNAAPYFNAEERLKPDIEAYSDIDTKEYKINIDSSIIIGSDGDTSPATIGSTQKFLALYAAKEVDVMIAPEPVIDMYIKADIFADPTEILSPEEIDRLSQKGYTLYYRKLSERIEPEERDTLMEDKDVCIGIVLNNSSYLSDIGAFPADNISSNTPVIFTFSSVSEHLESARSFLNLLTEGSHSRD